jgi:hypothetical protein
MDPSLDQDVRARAENCCEYCRIPQSGYPLQFELDHIIAAQHGGQTAQENLALCCPPCNRHKGPNIAGWDKETAQVVPLFNPRRHIWSEHFVLRGGLLIGLTPAGRATAHVLNFNHPRRIAVREALIAEGVYPP